MNITLVSKQHNLLRVFAVRNRIVEYYKSSGRKDLVDILVYDPLKNTCYEAAPDIRKTNYIQITNCIWDSCDLFFAECKVADDGNLAISIFRHDTETRETTLICSFLRKMEILNEDKRVRLFVLNDSTILMQTETLHKRISETRMGSIGFSLSLYHLDSGMETPVTETNLRNNGINTIIPFSDNRIMVKTGYSYLEDDRLDSSNESESFIESIYITTVAKLVADISLAKSSLDMPLIDSAYLDSHITRPFITGDMLHFSIVDMKNKNMKCVFYNIRTEERMDYSVVGFNPEDLNITYVINQIPYVRKTTDTVENFLNLELGETDIIFYDEKFLALIGNILITETIGKHPLMHVYSYPKLKLLAEEDRDYECSCMLHENCYIYC